MQSVTFLQLAPEFGGTKYGPFRGAEIRLGSDPASNDITLPQDIGVLPQHVKILQQSESSFIVAPVDRTATVFIWRQGKNKPKQITTPMAVTVGDGFSLVSPEGYRFIILTENLKKEGVSASSGFAERAMRRMPTSRGLLEEVKRRGFAKVFTTRLGNSAMYAYRFIITGQIFSPMYIVAGIMMVSGWLLAGGATCSAFSLNSTKLDFQQKWQACKDQRDGVQLGESRASVPGVTQAILDANQWRETLRDDAELYRAYAEELTSAFSEPSDYAVHYRRADSKFAQFRYGLAKSNPEGLVNTMAYAAANPTNTRSREWRIIVDSEGKEVCARGPLMLTYRQAKNLGLDNVQLDALVSESIALSRNPTEKQELLLETARMAGELDVSLAGTTIVDDGVSLSGGRMCMHVEGEDDRTDIAALVRAFNRQFGPNARGLPEENESHWLSLRLHKLAAMDFITYEDVEFQTRNAASTFLSRQPAVGPNRARFATQYAARIMAQAAVTRCSAVLDKDLIDSPPDHLGKLPELTQCAILKTFVEYDRLD